MSALVAAEPAVRPQPVRSETAAPMPRPASNPGLAALGLFLRNPSGLLGLAILTGLLFAALIGAVGGFLPAWSAARKNVITAMREI